MSLQHCLVCGIDFVPQDGTGYAITIGVPLCSSRCTADYHEVMNALADLQDAELLEHPPFEAIGH